MKIKDHQSSLVGTCLLIPPSFPPPKKDGVKEKEKPRHYIACLFTSLSYGRAVSPPEEILANTKKALEDLRGQIEILKAKQHEKEKANENEKGTGEGEGKGEGQSLGEVWSVRMNSGLFSVPWADTLAVLQDGGVDMRVVRPEGEAEREEKGREKRGGLNGVKRVGEVGGGGKGAKRAKSGRGEGRQGTLDGMFK